MSLGDKSYARLLRLLICCRGAHAAETLHRSQRFLFGSFVDAQILLLIPIGWIVYAWSKTLAPSRTEVIQQKRKLKKLKRKKTKYYYPQQITYFGEDDTSPLFADDTDCGISSNFDSTSDFDYSSDSDDFGTISESDPFEWNNDDSRINEWWSDPAYSGLEGNIYHNY
jgi:hypothetical protein